MLVAADHPLLIYLFDLLLRMKYELLKNYIRLVYIYIFALGHKPL